jgi:hypothetical protein
MTEKKKSKIKSKLKANAKEFYPKIKSKLKANAKEFYPKKKSKLRFNAKEFYPNKLPGINNFIENNVKYNNNVMTLILETKEQYADIVFRYMNIFQYVCNTRSTELNYANNALILRNNKIQKGMSFDNANYEAFMNLRTFKNKEASDKIQNYTKLLELEEELLEIFKTKKEAVKFINALNNSNIFELFLNNNPQCDVKIHPTYDYAGLKKYLKMANMRDIVINTRNYPNT